MSRETEQVRALLDAVNESIGHPIFERGSLSMAPPAGFDIRAAYDALFCLRGCVDWMLRAVENLERGRGASDGGSLRRPTM